MSESGCKVIISKSALGSCASGIPGAFVPGLDIAAIAGIWTTMIISIASELGRKFDKNTAGKFAISIAQGVAAYIGGSKLLMMLLHFIPGIGTLSVVALNSAFNYIYTFRVGKAVTEEFKKTNLDEDSFTSMASNILKIVSKPVTLSEIKDALSVLDIL